MENKIAVVGAGLVGSLLAALLAKKGHHIDLIERRPDLRKADISAGRSINLALSDRGLKALELIGLADQMKAISIPMTGRYLHDEDGTVRQMPYGKEGQHILSISRGQLNQKLLDVAEETGQVDLKFNAPCKHIDLNSNTITTQDYADKTEETTSYQHIFGTDGAFSVVRDRMMRGDRFDYSQHYISSGYKELSMPPVEGKKWAIDKNFLHIWPRKSFMLIALPNLDGSFTCTLFMPFEGEYSFSKLTNDAEVKTFFQTHFADAVPHMTTLMEDWHQNATSSLVTVKASPWHFEDKALLLGDAAHAIVPFYGQGMNAGFEDVTVLEELMSKGGNWADIFKQFSQKRVADGHAIADLAIANYTEMRDLVADPHFVKKRALSGKISQLMPDTWLPLYSMVTFSHIPYHEALAKGKNQDEILEKLVAAGLSVDSSDDAIKAAIKSL